MQGGGEGAASAERHAKEALAVRLRHCATRGQDHDGSGGGNGEGGAAGSGGGGGAGRRRGRAVGGGGGEVRSPVGGAKDAEGNAVQNGMTAGEDRRSVGGRGWCIGGRRRGRKVAEDRGVEGRREVEVAFLKRALEVTKSTGGREGLEGKSSADGGLGHGAEGLGLRQGHCDRDAFARA